MAVYFCNSTRSALSNEGITIDLPSSTTQQISTQSEQHSSQVQTEFEELRCMNKIHKSKPIHYNYVKDMKDINIGDHISYENHGSHFGIIVKKDENINKLTIMKYMHRAVISLQDVIINDGKFFAVNYENQVQIQLQVAIYRGPTFSPSSVVRRAYTRYKEQNYGCITNFASGFPRWCLTGNGGLTYNDTPVLWEKKERVTQARDVQRGDHVMEKYKNRSYHAIVLSVTGGDISVICFRSASCAIAHKSFIRLISFRRVYRFVYSRGRKESATDLAVMRAEKLNSSDLSTLSGAYSEYIATWCKTGVWLGYPFEFTGLPRQKIPKVDYCLCFSLNQNAKKRQ